MESAIRSRLAHYGRRLKPSYSPATLRKNVETETALLLEEEGIDIRRHVEPLLMVAESLRKYLKTLDAEMAKRAKEHPVCKLLMEVPGVGPLCALSFVSAVEDPERFRQTSDVGACLGLVPRRSQSGEMSRTLGITKTGNKLTRIHLVTAGQVMRTQKEKCALGEWGDKLKGRLGSGRAKVAVARKLAIVLLTMWKAGAHFERYPSRITDATTR